MTSHAGPEGPVLFRMIAGPALCGPLLSAALKARLRVLRALLVSRVAFEAAREGRRFGNWVFVRLLGPDALGTEVKGRHADD
jgi:hypothetical protein